jgi:hypothetical protein
MTMGIRVVSVELEDTVLAAVQLAQHTPVMQIENVVQLKIAGYSKSRLELITYLGEPVTYLGQELYMIVE